MGSLGAILQGACVAIILETAGWPMVWWLCAALCLLGAFCLMISPGKHRMHDDRTTGNRVAYVCCRPRRIFKYWCKVKPRIQVAIVMNTFKPLCTLILHLQQQQLQFSYKSQQVISTLLLCSLSAAVCENSPAHVHEGMREHGEVNAWLAHTYIAGLCCWPC